jgi:hypothetical protein
MHMLFKLAFLGAVVIATGGWVWILYAGFKWILEL